MRPLVVQTVVSPPASLMLPAEPLYTFPADREPTPVEVVETVSKNYGLYHDLAQRLAGLQDWVRSVSKQNNK